MNATQEMTKQTNAIVHLEAEGCGSFLQQMQPAAVLIIICADTRARADVNPRAKAGLLGYEHVSGVLKLTSETLILVASAAKPRAAAKTPRKPTAKQIPIAFHSIFSLSLSPFFLHYQKEKAAGDE